MTGLRLNVRKLQKGFQSKLARVNASAFRPELSIFTQKSLQSAIRLTPVRSISKIVAAQTKQYNYRINYIPSVHETTDPMLIVKNGAHWLYCNGRWWPASFRQLPQDIENIHMQLLAERERRMQIGMSAFIQGRAQARFFYRRTWMEAGQSLGMPVSVSANVSGSVSRHNPPKQPPRAFGQWRGGKSTLTVVIFNPFLQQESRYKNFDGRDILARAAAANRPAFDEAVSRKLATLMA